MRLRKRRAHNHIVIYEQEEDREKVISWKVAGNRAIKEGGAPPDLDLFFRSAVELLATEGIDDVHIITVPPPSFHEYAKDGGWYPAEIIARRICDGLSRDLDLLWPERYEGKSSKFMMKNESKVYDPPALDVRGKIVLILDDIATTGLTLSAACDAVCLAGGYPLGVGIV